MTTIDYKALAKRVELYAELGVEGCDFWRTDLRTVVSLLEGMADMEPAARIYTDAELVHRDPRWGRVCWIVPECEIDGGALLYLHPAPQPQPDLHCAHERFGVAGNVFDSGKVARPYGTDTMSVMGIVPMCDDDAWCDAASIDVMRELDREEAQPQPERQPVSEPTKEQITAAARALNDVAASECGIDRDDHWKVYSEHFIKDATAALRAALAAKDER